MSIWVVTHGGDFINLDHVVAIDAIEAKDGEGWVIRAVLSSDFLRLPGTFSTEAQAQSYIRVLLEAAGAHIPYVVT